MKQGGKQDVKSISRKEPEAEETAVTEGAKKAEKKEKKAREKKERPQRTEPAHMAKVNKFAETPPKLSPDALAVMESARELSSGELNVLAAHITLEARRRATSNASAQKLNPGDRVTIVAGGQTKFIGLEGVITRAQRIRCFVKVPNFDREVYLFNTDVEVIAPTRVDVSESDESEGLDEAANG